MSLSQEIHQTDVNIPWIANICAKGNCLTSQMGAEAVILDFTSGIYYGLDSISFRIWTLIQESQKMESIIEILVKEYDVEKEKCYQDVSTLIFSLSQEGLVIVDQPQVTSTEH